MWWYGFRKLQSWYWNFVTSESEISRNLDNSNFWNVEYKKQDLESAWNLESKTVFELFFATIVEQKINKAIEQEK